MLGKQMLSTMAAYNRHSNQRLFDAADRLSPEQLRSTREYSHGSLFDTLFHIVRTEWGWRTLCDSLSPPREPLLQEAFDSLESLRGFFVQEADALDALIDRLSEEELATRVEVPDPLGEMWTMTRWHMLMQPLLHSMQHRSEVAALLTGYGQSPGDMDFIFFV